MLYRSFVAHDQAAAMIHPAKATVDFPALAVTCPRLDGAAALRLAPLTARNGRNGRLDAPAAQSLTKIVAIGGFVRHQRPGASTWPAPYLRDPYGRPGGLRQLELVGLGPVAMQ